MTRTSNGWCVGWCECARRRVLGGLVLTALFGTVAAAEAAAHAQHTTVVRADGSDAGTVRT
ncbi:hypothetical protein [Streptomyces sp. CoH27]|uniref:hypothetical protein n=1 Tax=Streptomyces sp. CoH27 TaxID=2875763 RepID=UPI001CD24F5C|nr:hypothetical protein [Streptomyces sp. CoH27]